MLKIRTNPPFRVLYDLRWMELGEAGGVEQASYELVSAAANLDRKNRYSILAPRSACWEWSFPRGVAVERFYADEGDEQGRRAYAFIERCRAAALAPGKIAATARDPDFDLVHSTCSFIQPDLLGFPGVLTIQDLQHLHHPEFFSPEDWSNRERLYRDSATKAAHVICSSEFTRRDVHERYGVPLERMTTIWAIPSAGVWTQVPAEARRRLLAGMGITGPFLLYPAQGWPHKNHARLLQAFAKAQPELPSDLRLVLTGRPLPPESEASAMIRSAGPRVVHLGFRSPMEIRALIQACAALVFPSLFEGFGMPVAEAIIAGRPVACSNVTSLPEIAGEAAVLFDPMDPDAIASRMVEVTNDAGLRRSLEAAALRRRALFSPRAMALKTVAVYQRLFASLAPS